MESLRPKKPNRLHQYLSSLLACWLVIATWGIPAKRAFGQPSSAVVAVQTVLDDQVAAWNRGDVEGYMRGYWDSDSTVFTSAGTLTRGYNEVLRRYKKSYNTREKMGVLEFRDLVIQPLSPVIVIAMGVWQLHRESDKPWGRFTLIFEKKPEGWRITNDHTSSAEK